MLWKASKICIQIVIKSRPGPPEKKPCYFSNNDQNKIFEIQFDLEVACEIQRKTSLRSWRKSTIRLKRRRHAKNLILRQVFQLFRKFKLVRELQFLFWKVIDNVFQSSSFTPQVEFPLKVCFPSSLGQGRSVEKSQGGGRTPKKLKNPKTLRISRLLPFFSIFRGADWARQRGKLSRPWCWFPSSVSDYCHY